MTSPEGADVTVADADRQPMSQNSEDNAVGLVQAMGFIAWTDDRLVAEEKEMLAAAMDALGIPDARRNALCRALHDAPPKLSSIAKSLSDETERRMAIAQAILMAQVDGELTADERRDVAKLAAALEIDDEELQMLYAAVAVTGEWMSPEAIE
jgi:uncharacterized membrane protein YebE (DUF533 family)